MTPLEQKAREYANNQMRCYKCSDHQAPCKDNKCVNWHRCFKGYKRGYTEALRLRDVNVELPKKRDDDNSMIRVLVETKWDMLLLCVYMPKDKTFYSQLEDIDYQISQLKRWRPIELI